MIDGEEKIGKEPSLWENIEVIFELKGWYWSEKPKEPAELSMKNIVL